MTEPELNQLLSTIPTPTGPASQNPWAAAVRWKRCWKKPPR